MDYSTALKSTKAAIAALDNISVTTDPDLMAKHLTTFGKASEGVILTPKKGQDFPTRRDRITDAENFQVFSDWVNAMGALATRGEALTEKVKGVPDILKFIKTVRTQYALLIAAHFPPQPADAVADTREGPSEVVVKSRDAEGFTPVVTKAQKKKMQRVHRAERVAIDETVISDDGPAFDLGDAAYVFKRRPVDSLLAWRRPAYAGHDAKGERVKTAALSAEEKKKLNWLPIEDELFYALDTLTPKQLIELRENHIIDKSLFRKAYTHAKSLTQPVEDQDQVMTLAEATAAGGQRGVANARLAFWAAEAEELLEKLPSKQALVMELFMQLSEFPIDVCVDDAARKWTAFIRNDLSHKRSVNNSIRMMRKSLMASIKPGQDREDYINECTKTCKAVWGKDIDKVFKVYCENQPKGRAPKKKPTFAESILKPKASSSKVKVEDIPIDSAPVPGSAEADIAEETPMTYANVAKQAAIASAAAAASVAKRSYTASKKAGMQIGASASAAYQEAKVIGPDIGYVNWFKDWYASRVTMSVRGLRRLKSNLATQSRISRAWSWVKGVASSCWYKTFNLTPKWAKSTFEASVRIPRVTAFWFGNKVKFALRWLGSQVYDHSADLDIDTDWKIIWDADVAQKALDKGKGRQQDDSSDQESEDIQLHDERADSPQD